MELLKRVKNAQQNLEKLRLENKTLDPVKEAGFLKNSIDNLEKKIIGLNSENLRLDIIKDNLEKGILLTQGITSKNIGGESNYLSLTSSDKVLLKELIDLKAKLANSSVFVECLEGRLSKTNLLNSDLSLVYNL